MYNVKDLRKNLSEIDSLIGQMNMFQAAESILVKEEPGAISFNWTLPNETKYSMNISCSSPETFKCVRIEEIKPIPDRTGLIKQKNAMEVAASIHNGFITLTTNCSMLNNFECKERSCNNVTSAEKKYYTPRCVMQQREYKGYQKQKLNLYLDNLDANSMLYVPRQAFAIGGDFYDQYNTRSLLVRDKLDTARVYLEDKSEGIVYSAINQLSQEHGLRDMILPGGYDPYPKDIVISLLSPEEIEAMIKKEDNPKVEEDLRVFAKDRENYYYSTSEDKNFIYKGIPESQNATSRNQ